MAYDDAALELPTPENRVHPEDIYPFEELAAVIPGEKWEGYDVDVLNAILGA
jgi:hypothetical protein